MVNKNSLQKNSIDSEKIIERKLKHAIVVKRGGLCIKLETQFFSGLPDRLCILPKGRLFFAEIKTTGQKPNRLQISIHKMLKGLGFNVYVIDSFTKLDLILSCIDYE